MPINSPTPVNRPGVTLKPGPVSLGPHQPDVISRINPGGTIMKVDPPIYLGPPITPRNDKRWDRRDRRNDRGRATDYRPILGS